MILKKKNFFYVYSEKKFLKRKYFIKQNQIFIFIFSFFLYINKHSKKKRKHIFNLFLNFYVV